MFAASKPTPAADADHAVKGNRLNSSNNRREST